MYTFRFLLTGYVGFIWHNTTEVLQVGDYWGYLRVRCSYCLLDVAVTIAAAYPQSSEYAICHIQHSNIRGRRIHLGPIAKLVTEKGFLSFNSTNVPIISYSYYCECVYVYMSTNIGLHMVHILNISSVPAIELEYNSLFSEYFDLVGMTTYNSEHFRFNGTNVPIIL